MPEIAEPAAAADREAQPLMTLAEAAAACGRPKEALRAMIRRGRLHAKRGNNGQFLVALPPEMREQHGQPQRGRAAKRTEAAANGAADRAAELEDVVEEWRLAAEEARLAAAVAAAERDAAAATIEVLKAGLEHERAERGQLAAELALARKSWFERLLEALRRR
jgi:hypothetical protein